MSNFKIGKSGKKIFRIKNILFKEKSENNDLVIKILNFLNDKKCVYVPKIILQDTEYYQLTYIKGKTIKKFKHLSKSKIKHLAFILKSYYEITKEILTEDEIQNNIGFCHGDINPHNLVFYKNKIKAIIDWDGIYKGNIKNDIYFAIWTCANLGSTKISNKKKQKLIFTFVNSYNDPNIFINFCDQMILIMRDYANNHKNSEQIQKWSVDSINWIQKNKKEINKKIG